MKIYLLSIQELQNGIVSQENCLAKLDSHRREKALRMRESHARNLSVGAGLLLQLAAIAGREEADREEVDRTVPEGLVSIHTLSVTQLLDLLKETSFPQEMIYAYDANGKPQFADHLGGADSFPRFNLSHSGDYVSCAFFRADVGIDIQKKAALRDFRVAEKWFSEREKVALSACTGRIQKEACFYRIWTKKEAYAKLTGEGIGTGIAIDTTEAAGENRAVRWLELPAPDGYCMTVCCYVDDCRKRGQDDESEKG